MAKMNVTKCKNNTNTIKNRLNWFDNNPFFNNKEGYDGFIEAMITAAEEGNLPLSLQHTEPENVTMYDIKQFSQRFKQDTGLYIEFKLVTCNHCDKLHCCMVIDEFPDGEEHENIVYV